MHASIQSALKVCSVLCVRVEIQRVLVSFPDATKRRLDDDAALLLDFFCLMARLNGNSTQNVFVLWMLGTARRGTQLERSLGRRTSPHVARSNVAFLHFDRRW